MDLVTFTEEILKGKLAFLCSDFSCLPRFQKLERGEETVPTNCVYLAMVADILRQKATT